MCNPVKTDMFEILFSPLIYNLFYSTPPLPDPVCSVGV